MARFLPCKSGTYTWKVSDVVSAEGQEVCHAPDAHGMVQAQAVRGSKLGSRFTVAGIKQYMQEKEQKQVEYRRTMQDIEESKWHLDDYEEWQNKSEVSEGAEHPETDEKKEISFYEAFDRFQSDNGVSENDEEIFYGGVFQEFNEQWQGKSKAVLEKKPEIIGQEKVGFLKLSLEERAKILLPSIGDQMAESKEYQKRMEYDERKMKSMKYKMTVYDEFLKEYKYRKKQYSMKDNIKNKQRERER